MFGCRSVGFQYVLTQNVETERSNTTEDQAESVWYNCVLFKHPCTASLQDSYRRGQYHFIKMGELLLINWEGVLCIGLGDVCVLQCLVFTGSKSTQACG